MHYTESHEWIKINGSIGTVGISSYAQKELGEIVYVQLPKLGQIIKKNQELCVLESTKAAADVYSPVSGTITAINDAAIKNPSLINEAPESNGWLLKIELSSLEEVNHLLTQEQYKKLINH